MKMKSWVLWLLVVTFLASEIILFSALRQKEAAQFSLQTETQRADKLQAELDELKNSNADAQNAEMSRLRAENLDLPRLRNEVTQLQATNHILSRQLQATITYARQQLAQVQQLTATQRAQTEIAERNACIDNLREIDAAKQQWALEKGKTAEAFPTTQDLLPYLKDGIFPVCPAGGIYTLHAVGYLPSCSFRGHVMTQ